MSSKRRNRSRWDSPRSAPNQPSGPTAASSAAAALSPQAAATTAASAAHPTVTSPAAIRNRSPHVVTPVPPLSDFALDYRYEFSLPAQRLLSRLERQPWLDPLSDYSSYSASHDQTGYSLQGRRYGSLAGDAPSQLEDYPLNQSSKILQHYAGAYQNEKAELSAQLLPGLASQASYLDLERDRRRAAALAQQNSSLYGMPSGAGDLGQPLPLGRSLELSSGRLLGGGAVDAKMGDGQVGSASLSGGTDVLKVRDTSDKSPTGSQDPKLYCSVCDRSFATAHQKDAHLQAHVKCEEENCQYEATARKVKEHMLSEHGKQFKNAVRGSAGNLKEGGAAQASEIQKSDSEKADKVQNNDHSDAREKQRTGLLTPTGDARNDSELVARKSRESRNYRLPGRYFPY